jgi:hypothetical protein
MCAHGPLPVAQPSPCVSRATMCLSRRRAVTSWPEPWSCGRAGWRIARLGKASGPDSTAFAAPRRLCCKVPPCILHSRRLLCRCAYLPPTKLARYVPVGHCGRPGSLSPIQMPAVCVAFRFLVSTAPSTTLERHLYGNTPGQPGERRGRVLDT